MNITKEIIHDLIPLYAVNECSPDTRRAVEEYLREYPREAEEIKRILQTPIPRSNPPLASQEEARALCEARRRLSRQKWLMGLAIFFSLIPMTFVYQNGHVWWFFRDAPGSALVYIGLAVLLWIMYRLERRHPRSL